MEIMESRKEFAMLFFFKVTIEMKILFSEGNILKKNNLKTKSIANFGEVQKLRFWTIFSKAPNKLIFLRMFIKNLRKALIT